MARQLRIEYAGACYHVMCRGNGGKSIYNDDHDRQTFLETLWECCKQTGWIVHAYVLMENHYHILLETPEANLVAGMKWFQGTYTQRYNARHHQWGHLYQGRYKSLVIDDEDPVYFKTVGTYIHLNPVHSHIIDVEKQSVQDYRWSSLSCYSLPPSKRPPAIMLSRVLESFYFKDTRAGRKAYLVWLQKRAVEELDPKSRQRLAIERKSLKRGWYMGTEDFRDQLLSLIDKSTSDNFRGDQRREHGEYMAKEYIKNGLKSLQCSLSDIKEMPQNDIRKQALVWLIKKNTVVTGEWIRKEIDMGGKANISRALHLFDHSKERDIIKIKKKMSKWTG